MTPGKKTGIKLYWNGTKFVDPKERRKKRNRRGYRRYLTRYVAEREATNVVLLNPHLVGSVFVVEG